MSLDLDQNRQLSLPARVEQALLTAVERLAEQTGVRLPPIQLDFSLQGHCAGQARIRGQRLQLRINQPLLERYSADYLAQTIPHEIAHLHVMWVHRFKRRKPRPHGPEWQAVMQDCFGLEPQRCHSYETTPARVVRRAFLYSCRCRQHHFTKIMHNRIRRARQAVCRSCQTPLEFLGVQPHEK